MSYESVPTRSVAGVNMPDTPLVKKAIKVADKALHGFVFNHVMRSMLYGFTIGDVLFPNRDKELHAVATILHDLGWDQHAHSPYVSPDKRFEVDGAIAARKFVDEHTHGDAAWDAHRKQLLWDAIALHTTPSISSYKEDEVNITGMGIVADFLGTKTPGGLITQEVLERVSKEYPYAGFRDGVNSTLTGLCQSKPATTYDTFMQPFGQFVEGYDPKGKTFQSGILPLAPN